MRRLTTIIALGLAASFAALPAFAQNQTPRPKHPDVQGHRHAPDQAFIQGSSIPCICHANGRTFLEGDSICLNGMVAYCDMEQNVTTWRLTQRVCPQS